MRRAVARGRMFPQSYSTDRRYGRLSLKAIGLFPLMWSNADDQGRLCGDFEEIKYAVCPNIDHITKQDIPDLLQELQDNKLILCYSTPKSTAIQMLDWWYANQKMQWAWPSDYQPPEGWKDHLRYKRGAKEVVTRNWPVSGEHSGEDNNGTQVSSINSSGESSGERSGEHSSKGFPHLPKENIKETIKRKRRGRGNSPEDSGEELPSPSLTGLSTDEIEILHTLTTCFKREWGRVPAEAPDTVILREPVAKESAQLRDLARELSSAGGCPLDYIGQAFREAAERQKFHVSYVRAVLHAWLGLERGPPGE